MEAEGNGRSRPQGTHRPLARLVLAHVRHLALCHGSPVVKRNPAWTSQACLHCWARGSLLVEAARRRVVPRDDSANRGPWPCMAGDPLGEMGGCAKGGDMWMGPNMKCG